MPQKKLAIFDFDGTLVNLKTDWITLKQLLNKRHKLDFYGKPFVSVIAQVRSEYPIVYKTRIKPLIVDYELKGLDQVQLIEGVEKLITKYQYTAILSNNYRETIKAAIKKLSVPRMFPNYIVGLDDCIQPKPHSDGINKILKKLRIQQEETVYYGDSQIDRETGIKAGIETVILGDK